MRRNPREKVAIRAIRSRCGPTCDRLTCIAAVFSVMDKALLLAEMFQYLDSGFRRNDGPKAGASPGYFADEICSLRFDRLSANGGQAHARHRANGKTGTAANGRQANGETGSANGDRRRTARQAQGWQTGMRTARQASTNGTGARLGRYVWFCKGASRDTAKTVQRAQHERCFGSLCTTGAKTLILQTVNQNMCVQPWGISRTGPT